MKRIIFLFALFLFSFIGYSQVFRLRVDYLVDSEDKKDSNMELPKGSLLEYNKKKNTIRIINKKRVLKEIEVYNPYVSFTSGTKDGRKYWAVRGESMVSCFIMEDLTKKKRIVLSDGFPLNKKWEKLSYDETWSNF